MTLCGVWCYISSQYYYKICATSVAAVVSEEDQRCPGKIRDDASWIRQGCIYMFVGGCCSGLSFAFSIPSHLPTRPACPRCVHFCSSFILSCAPISAVLREGQPVVECYTNDVGKEKVTQATAIPCSGFSLLSLHMLSDFFSHGTRGALSVPCLSLLAPLFHSFYASYSIVSVSDADPRTVVAACFVKSVGTSAPSNAPAARSCNS
jgi:hypothetical protein